MRAWMLLAAVGLAGVAWADPLQMPLVKNGNGLPVAAGAAVCVRLDGTACPRDPATGAALVYQTSVPAPTYVSAPSTVQAGTVTSSAASKTSGAVAFAGGTATIGPVALQAGRDLWMALWGTWQGSCQLFRSPAAGAPFLPVTDGSGNAKFVWTSTSAANLQLQAPVMNDQVVPASWSMTCSVTGGALSYDWGN
jgi:hypothetical protein